MRRKWDMGYGEMHGEKTMPEKTDKIIKNHVLGALGVSLIPIPLIDLMALVGIQLNMLRKLAKAYEIPFSDDRGKHLIASLLGSGIPLSLGNSLGSAVKAVPVIGQIVGQLTMPAVSGSTTYAMGKVFIQHFESGGTFLNFDPEKVRAYYAEMLEDGEKVVNDLKHGSGAISEPAEKEIISAQTNEKNLSPGEAEERKNVSPAGSDGSPAPSEKYKRATSGPDTKAGHENFPADKLADAAQEAVISDMDNKGKSGKSEASASDAKEDKKTAKKTKKVKKTKKK